MRGYLYNACEEIDACLLSGDVLFHSEELAALKEYLARWNRVIEAHEAQIHSEKDTER